jgi:hypothetical protein
MATTANNAAMPAVATNPRAKASAAPALRRQGTGITGDSREDGHT